MAYLSIINKNHSALEEIRVTELAHREEVRSARANHCADICQAIADILQDDYLAWVDAQPVHGFYDAACDILLDLMRSPIWTSYTPSDLELSRRSYRDMHAYGHNCPLCNLTLTVNEEAHKTTNPDAPFYMRRLTCPAYFTTGCRYTELFTAEVMREIYEAGLVLAEISF